MQTQQSPGKITDGVYRPTHNIRFVTAASLFDGHDASINIIRRILQASGAEVIHLGHNRSVREVAVAAVQEDVHGIAVSSYQGGHTEYFKYLKDLLVELGAPHIKVYGGGGGVIVAEEIEELHRYGIARIFSPEDGRVLGLQGMINHMLAEVDADLSAGRTGSETIPSPDDFASLGRWLSWIENEPDRARVDAALSKETTGVPVLGITGPGGAGKSSITDEIALRFLDRNPGIRLAIVATDPTRRKTGGALLGDRIRLNTLAVHGDRVFMRSLATRESHNSYSDALPAMIQFLRLAGFDAVIVETAGTGQSDSGIVQLSDASLYVMTAEFGAPTQLEKIAMLDFADFVALNKSEKAGTLDALHHIRKQIQRNRELFSQPVESMPVLPTCAGRFNDPGVSRLYNELLKALEKRKGRRFEPVPDAWIQAENESTPAIIPAARSRYLSETADSLRSYHKRAADQAERAHRAQSLDTAAVAVGEASSKESTGLDPESLRRMAQKERDALDGNLRTFLENYDNLRKNYSGAELSYEVRGKEFKQKLQYTTLAGLPVPLVALPAFESHREIARFFFRENLPGHFPYTAGTFPFRRSDEAPTRMFAGEGGPERTNIRFHYLSRGQGARLSTAFDSVTLYGEDPARRPDIYGKIGNSGVSVPTLDDAKRLYSGFDLAHPSTSVSMTINGPAPVLLAFFFNTAVDQAVERHLRETGGMEEAKKKLRTFYTERGGSVPSYRRELPKGHDHLGLGLLGLSGDHFVDAETYGRIRADVLTRVRGTVQADILKEDQAQNTCIFSTPFALRMMGDIQQFFTQNRVSNFYSVSISGYHIAEAGANPITQLAFTLANGLTYAEYYLSRGLKIDDFAPNFSFFFSNGLDAEYAVIGRVARRIWAVAMKNLYGASERSQKLKYHIQTSGRSLHAMEIDFNDIRTTLQALYALYDNTNSLHTNAFDEAITTPTEQSVRRALAIQLIINQELGLNKNQNSLQGSYVIEELTDLVEEAVLSEFDRLTQRGGVLGAMETMYQRTKIQEESLHYETLKHSGALPIIGVNTFLGRETGAPPTPELIRSTDDEKESQVAQIADVQSAFADRAPAALTRLKEAALRGGNIFEELMETVKVATLGQISGALYGVGGSYRRNM